MLAVINRAFDLLLAAFGLLFVGVMAYGIANFPDAPISRCGAGQFCGKSHRLHTEDEFKAFVIWQGILLPTALLAAATGGLLAWRMRRRAPQDLDHLLAVQWQLPASVEEPRYAAAWKDRRRRKVVALVLGLAAVAAVVWRADDGLPAALPVTLLVASALCAFIWFNAFACPRCRHLFLSRQSPGRCHACGLPLGESFSASLRRDNDAGTSAGSPR